MIYDELQRITNVPQNACDALKKLECDVELDQSIPITENILQVKAGDILISDMYLPEELIREMLTKAGLIVPVEIVITSGGKSSGRVWKQLAEQKKVVFHIGDNPNSDIKNPRFAGFESALTILSEPTPLEQHILRRYFNFGAYLREIRLRNPFSEEIKRLYWGFSTVNMGLLILLVRQIDELQKKFGFEYLGFCGRDVHYLRLLYEKYKRDRGEVPVPNDYLYYSRKLVRYSGTNMAKYFADKIKGRKALMIDLYGSGTHLHTLRETFNLKYSTLICLLDKGINPKTLYPTMSIAKNWNSALVPKFAVTTDKANFFIVTPPPEENIMRDYSIELLNRATHNSPIRLKLIQVGEKLLPEVVFSEINDTENFDVLKTCLDEVMKSNWVFPENISERLETFIYPLINFITSFIALLPLRNKHQVSERSDSLGFKLYGTMPAQKK